MDRNALKRYAPQARRDFIAAINDRAGQYGLTKKKCEAVTFQGDVALIGGRPHPASIGRLQQRLAERIGREGFDAVMEAAAYTWFNRFVAIRYMELHGYLDHGYRVLSHPEGKTVPEILEHAEHISLPGLHRDRVIELKLAGNKDNELYRILLVAQCNALSTAMPFLFERIDDETELLLPENLLHSDSLIRKLVSTIPEENWQEIEIIGWLYQFYISEKKDEVIGKVVKTEDIPAATQLFTPNWIVKYLVQNSIGRKWLSTYTDSPLRQQMEYYIEPAEQTAEVQAQLKAMTPDSLNPEEISLLDPACGSGHILVEAYDIFKAIYQERGYRMKDIPRLILSNNLFGLEIDARAAQLASFALIMKARADDRNVLQGGIRMNIRCIQSSDDIKAEEVYEALTGVDVIAKSGLPPAEDFFEEDTAPLFAHLRNQSVVESRNAGTDPSHSVRLRQSPHSSSPAPSPSPLVPSSPLSPDPCPLTPSSLRHLLSLFHGDAAQTFGSLIRIPGELAKLLPELVDRTDRLVHGNDLTRQRVAERFAPIAEQAWLLGRTYDAVVANPPYMGTKGMNPELKAFAVKAFPEGKSDLCTMFLLRGCELAAPTGYNAMIVMQSWMFLSSYEKLRERLLAHQTIVTMAHFGAQAFDTIGGAVVQTAATVLWNTHRENYPGGFIRLIDGTNEAEKEAALRTVCASLSSSLTTNDQRLATSSPSSLAPSPSSLVPNSSLAPSPYPLIPNFHRAVAEDFKKIPGSPIAYWVSERVRDIFEKGTILKKIGDTRQGMATSDNNRFLRLWSEVSVFKSCFNALSRDDALESARKWFPYNKGGDFRKWYGNSEFLVNWENDGKELLEYAASLYGSPTRTIKSLSEYFKPCVSWSKISSANLAMRHYPFGYIFDVAGCCIFSKSNTDLLFLLGFSNTIMARNLLSAISPTLNFEAGQIASLPILDLDRKEFATFPDLLVKKAKSDWDSYETSWDFTTLPLLQPDHHHPKLTDTYAHLRAHWMEMTLEMQRLEEENNRLFIEAYGLQAELTPEVPLEEITLTCNPHYRYSGDKTEEELETQLQTDTTKELLSYAVGCMMGRYSLDTPGLVLASQGETIEDYLFRVSERAEAYDEDQVNRNIKSVAFMEDARTNCFACGAKMSVPDARFIIAGSITDAGEVRGRPLVYCAQCADHDRASYVTWQQPLNQFSVEQALDRMWCETETLAIFLGMAGCFGHRVPAEPSSLLFMPDDDGIIPLTDYEWFDDDVTERFVTFIATAWPKEHLEENLQFIAESLGQRKDETPRDTIRRYFATDFYKDHLPTYKRRPIYWLFASGKLRAFQGLVYLHRYNEGTLSRMRTEYVIPLQGKMTARMEHLENDIATATTTSQRKKCERERDLLRKQLEELRTFDDKLRHYADQRITLDLDDGVKVNYGKFGNLLGEVKAVTGGTGE
jgi:type II restriction/modification system DNA methylase subunit YeeA